MHEQVNERVHEQGMSEWESESARPPYLIVSAHGGSHRLHAHTTAATTTTRLTALRLSSANAHGPNARASTTSTGDHKQDANGDTRYVRECVSE